MASRCVLACCSVTWCHSSELACQLCHFPEQPHCGAVSLCGTPRPLSASWRPSSSAGGEAGDRASRAGSGARCRLVSLLQPAHSLPLAGGHSPGVMARVPSSVFRAQGSPSAASAALSLCGRPLTCEPSLAALASVSAQGDPRLSSPSWVAAQTAPPGGHGGSPPRGSPLSVPFFHGSQPCRPRGLMSENHGCTWSPCPCYAPSPSFPYIFTTP